MPAIVSKIGERIAILRRQKGYSQTELAKAVGISREAIGKYERAEATASVDTAKRIADALDVTLDYLVDESAAPSFDKKTVERMQQLQQLADKDQEHVFAIIDAYVRDARARVAYG